MAKHASLGEYLKSGRENKNYSLRKVEALTSISNPYLSQMESDKIKQPSPIMLHKLSELYELPYENVLKLAGYPVPGAGRGSESGETVRISQFASRIGAVTKQEEDSLFEYLEFLRSRGKKVRRK
jgi:transcriptional regulator with XRE-family HTH domain